MYCNSMFENWLPTSEPPVPDVVADSEEVVCQALGTLRTQMASKLGLVDPTKKEFKIAWILDFPSFIWDEEEKRWAANHHPFTSPRDEDLDKLESNPGAVLAKAYDLVINGYECAGGSIRIHNPDVQSHVFRVLGMTPEQGRERFGFLLDALKYGAPPHGGIALGLDRWTMMLAGYAVALRFIHYSDGHGNLHLWGMVLVVALGLVVAVASIYLIYVLEILKFNRLRRQSLARRAEVEADGEPQVGAAAAAAREPQETVPRREVG